MFACRRTDFNRSELPGGWAHFTHALKSFMKFPHKQILRKKSATYEIIYDGSRNLNEAIVSCQYVNYGRIYLYQIFHHIWQTHATPVQSLLDRDMELSIFILT